MTTLPSIPRVGFAGLGFASSSLHLPALVALGRTALVGGADPDLARRNEWAGRAAGPAYATVEELLTSVKPDILVVATPPQFHADHCSKALDAGAWVLCEKPFMETVAQADSILAQAEAVRRPIGINHEFRYMPIFSSVRTAVGTAGVGQPVFLSCTQLMDLAPWDEPVAWRAAMPNRALLEAGVHLLDLLDSVVGRPPLSIVAHTSSGPGRGSGADAVHLVTLDYGDGLLGQVNINRLCKAATRYVELRVDCQEASLRASYGGRALVRVGLKRAEQPGIRVDFGLEGMAWSERGTARKVLGRNPRHATVLATQALWADVLDAWRQGLEPPSSARGARDTLRVVEAAYRSAESGQAVHLV